VPPAADTIDRDQSRPTQIRRPGRLITFEGGEGGGKTTQLLRLAERLKKAGLNVIATREPGGTPLAEAIRKFVLSGAARSLGAEGEAILFAAARADHVDRLIRPALDRGDWVLCDRYTDSTRAYQGAAGVDPGVIRALERIAVGQTRPDLTVILDLPVEIGLSRAASRNTAADRFESDPADIHRQRRAIFLAIARQEPERCVVIDAARPESEVTAAIWQAVAERLAVRPVRNDG
jgi:dTMP kinase